MGCKMAEVLRVAPDDTIEQIRSRLSGFVGREVYLYIPNGNHALRQRLSFALLLRAADDLGIALTVVSRHSAIRVAAANAGLHVVWRVPGGQSVTAAKRAAGLGTPLAGSPIMLGGLATVLLVAGLVAAVLVRPRATIVLTPATVQLSRVVTVEADAELSDIDATDRRMPARPLVVDLQSSRREPITARVEVPDQAARGTVVLVNQGESEITVPAGSQVSTGGTQAVSFRILDDVALSGPAGTTARVAVEAEEPGPVGNVPAYSVNVLDPRLALAVAVVNDQPMTGGSVRRVGTVTPADRDQLRDALLQQIPDEARPTLLAELRQGEALVQGSMTVDVLDESFSEHAFSEQDVLQVDLAVRIEALAVDLDQARRLAEQGLREEAGDTQGIAETHLDSQVQEVVMVEPGVAAIEVQVSATATNHIRADEVRRAVRGRRVDEAESVLAEHFPLASTPLIDVSNAWLGRLPWLPYQIEVVIVNSATRVG